VISFFVYEKIKTFFFYFFTSQIKEEND